MVKLIGGEFIGCMTHGPTAKLILHQISERNLFQLVFPIQQETSLRMQLCDVNCNKERLLNFDYRNNVNKRIHKNERIAKVTKNDS